MSDLPIQFLSPIDTAPAACVSPDRLIDPDLIDFDQLATEEQKSLVLHLIEKSIWEIEKQNRFLTEWEADTLTGAIGATMSGMYKLAMTKIELAQLKRNAVVYQQVLYSNCEHFTCEQIRNCLAQLH